MFVEFIVIIAPSNSVLYLIFFPLHSDYFCRPECKDSEKVLEAIESLQSDSDRDVRYFAGRDEEVPYEGRESSDDPTYMLRTTSRESLEEEMVCRSPLDSEFAESQIEARLLGVETTGRGNEEAVAGIPLDSGSDEGFEDTEQCLGDEESENSEEVGDETTGDESGEVVRHEGDKSCAAVENKETGKEERQISQNDEESKTEDNVESSAEREKEQVEANEECMKAD